MNQTLDLSGQVSVITGAGAGVGRATALRLSEQGVSVALLGRTLSTLQETAAYIHGSSGATFVAVADISEEQAVEVAFKELHEHFGRLDSLILSAGVGLYGKSKDYSLADWHTTIETNLTGAFLCCRAAFPHLRQSGSGSIIAISSGAGKQGYPEMAAYSASKFGLMGMMQSLAAEWGSSGIRVSTIVPGSILTGFGGRPVEEQIELLEQGRKYLQPDDIARAVVYLLQTPEGAWTQEMNLWPV